MKIIALKDYAELNPYEAMIYDKRGFFTLLFDILKEENVIFNLLYHYSIMEPLSIRLVLFYLSMILNFFLNAFFFSDDYIDARAEMPPTESVIHIYNFKKKHFNLIIFIIIQN